jgi:hypothetical protein
MSVGTAGGKACLAPESLNPARPHKGQRQPAHVEKVSYFQSC